VIGHRPSTIAAINEQQRPMVPLFVALASFTGQEQEVGCIVIIAIIKGALDCVA